MEIVIGFAEYPRMIIIENDSVSVLSYWISRISLSEMEPELNFTKIQKGFLQRLRRSYPDSMKVSASYSCKLADFRCLVSCDIGHRIVKKTEHSVVYDHGINRSVIEMCAKGHAVDILQNSSSVISDRWFDLCRKVFLTRTKTPGEVFGHNAGNTRDPYASVRASFGFVATVASTIAFVILVVIFVFQKRLNPQILNEVARRLLRLCSR